MATRLYLPASGTVPLATLAFDANWELTTSATRYPCFTTKQNTALADVARTWGATSTQQWVFFQFQSQTMKAGYSWTSDTVSMVIRGLQAANQTDSHLAYSVRVVSATGTTVRGTVGLFHTISTEFITSARTRIHSARGDGSGTFTSYAGDRIIIEIGVHGDTPTASAVTLRIGDPSATADFALTADLTTDLCPWVELSRTVTFGNASIAGVTGGVAAVSGTMRGYGKQYISGSTAGVAAGSATTVLKGKGKLYNSTNGRGVAAVSGTLTGKTGSTEYISGKIGGIFTLSDDFQSLSTGNLAGQGNWVTCRASQQIDVVDASGDHRFQGWSGLEYSERCCMRSETFSADQYSQCTIDSVPGDDGNDVGVAVRCNRFDDEGWQEQYFAYYGHSLHRAIFYSINGGWVAISECYGSGLGLSVGDVLRLEAEGNTLRAYLNGSLDTELNNGATVDVSAIIADPNYSHLAGGAPGVAVADNGAQGDDWQGGNLFGSVCGAAVSGTLKGKVHLYGSTGIIRADNFEGYSVGDLPSQGNWLSASPDAYPPTIVDVTGNKQVAIQTHISEGCAYLSGAFNEKQFAQATVLTLDGINQIGVAVRCSGNGVHNDCNYFAYYTSTDYRNVGYVKAGEGLTEFGVITGSNISASGDVLRIEVEGDVLRCYLNGSLDTAMSGGGIYDISSYNIDSGAVGLATWYYSGTNTSKLDNWTGGELIQVIGTLTEAAAPAGELVGSTDGVALVGGTLSQFGTAQISGSSAGTAFAPNELASSLTAYYKFNETSGTIHDSTPNNIDSARTGAGVTLNQSGKIGTSFLFNNSNTAFIELPIRDELKIGTKDFSFGGWFYTNNASDQINLWGGTNFSVALGLMGGHIYLGYTNVEGFSFTNSHYVTGQWNFVVVVFDSHSTTLNATCYLNGSSETITANFDASATVAVRLLGADSYNTADTVYCGFDGRLDELFMFVDKILTADEVAYIYNLGDGRAFEEYTSGVKGTLTAQYYLYGDIQGISTVSGTLRGKGSLSSISDTSLITNGTFDSDSDWSWIAAWSIANGIATFDDSENAVLQQHPMAASFIAATKYILRFNLIIGVGETAYFWMDWNGQDWYLSPTQSAVSSGTKIYPFVSPDSIVNPDGIMFNGRSASTTAWSIDYFSIRILQNCPAGVATVSGTLYNATPTTAAGTIDGVTALTGVLKGRGRLYGASDGVALVSGTLKGKGKLYGTINGVTAVSGVLKGKGKLYGLTAGVAAGSATTILKGRGKLIGATNGVAAGWATSVLKGKGKLYGLTAGVAAGSVTSVLKGKGKLYGATNGIAALTGVLKSRYIIGRTDGVATASATLKAKGKLYGTTTGVALVGAALRAKGKLYGTTGGVALVSGTLHGHGVLAGQTNGITALTGVFKSRYVVGAINGVAVVSATLKAKGKLIGSTSGVALLIADLNAKGKLYGATNGVATLTGVLKAKGKLYGATNGVATAGAKINGAVHIVGSTAGVALLVADLNARGKLYGTTTGVSTLAGVLKAKGRLYGATNGVAACSLTGHLKGYVTGTTAGVTALTGVLKAKGRLAGRTDGVAYLVLISSGVYPAHAATDGVAVVSATLKAKGRLYGTTNGVTLLTVNIRSRQHISAVMAGVTLLTGVLKGRGKLYGSTSGVAATSATLVGHAALQGVTNGSTIVTATARAKGRLSGSSDGVTLCAATLKAKGKLIGSTSGVTAVSGTTYNSTPSVSAQGQTIGIAALTGVLKGKGRLYATTNGVAVVSASLSGLGRLAGAIEGRVSVSGVLSGKGVLYVKTDGVASASATLRAKGRLAGVTNGVSTASGFIPGEGGLYAAITGVTVVSGTLIAKGRLSGSTAGVSALTVNLRGRASISGRTDGVTLVQVIQYAEGQLLAYIICTPTVSATLHGHGRLSGTTAGVANAYGFVPGDERLLGHTEGVSAVSGVLYGTGVLQGLIEGATETTCTAGSKLHLAGTIVTSSTLQGILLGLGRLLGQTDGIADLQGDVWGISEGQVFGHTGGIADVLGQLIGTGQLQGVTAGVSEVVGVRTIPWLYEKIEKNSYITGVISANSYITISVTMNSVIKEQIVMNSIIKDNDE